MADEVYLFTIKEAAEFLRISASTLYQWGRKKKGPPMYKLQRLKKSQWRIPKDKLIQWVESKNKER